MKIYQCKFCKKKGTRKEVRACIMTHIKTNKRKSIDKKSSVITEAMLSWEI